MGKHGHLDIPEVGSGALEEQASSVDLSHPPWAQFSTIIVYLSLTIFQISWVGSSRMSFISSSDVTPMYHRTIWSRFLVTSAALITRSLTLSSAASLAMAGGEHCLVAIVRKSRWKTSRVCSTEIAVFLCQENPNVSSFRVAVETMLVRKVHRLPLECVGVKRCCPCLAYIF
jgi:hypothetical protein